MSDARIAVIGLGHALLGDDALGLAVVRALDDVYAVPPSVAVVDAGSCGLDLAGYLIDRDEVIFVDALDLPAPAGTMRTIGHDELMTHAVSGLRFAPHEPSIREALLVAELSGRGPHTASLIGIVPGVMDVGVELSPAVADAVPGAVDEVVKRLGQLGVALQRRAKTKTEKETETEGVRISLRGVVQGVGLRPWVYRIAHKLGLRGTVVNTSRGVVIDAFGAKDDLDALVAACATDLPGAARVEELASAPIRGFAPRSFTIEPTDGTGAPLPSIPPDAAMCPACRAEIDDPDGRRFGYAFNACTACGPRYAVVTQLPFDRARTSMARFPMCADCAREYGDPGDRRFHAELVSCARCGPRLWIEDACGRTCAVDDPVAAAADRILAGEIIAVHGLGGFHLACDATSPSAVARLRVRKRRDEKPFAVMVSSLEKADAIAEVSPRAREVLTSPRHPIALLPARPSEIASSVSLHSKRIGLFLPYTPLHHLLCSRVGRPIVLTSANLGGEPICTTPEDARRLLSGVADAFLLHDRPIVRRVEDSVVGVDDRETRVLRRARGYAPEAIRLPAPAPEPILAVGAHLKNTVCLVVGDRAYLSPHLGDLETYDAERAFRHDIDVYERLIGVHPDVVAHDLHPDYASTRYARDRGASRMVAVQHHHAHVLAVAAELALEGPIVAAVYDGTGLGTDGTSWGGEILQVDGLSYRRPFSLRPLPLAGGDVASRNVWRVAWALLLDAFGPDAHGIADKMPVFDGIRASERHAVARMIEAGIGVTSVRGVGRYFDAFGALGLGRARATFEGQVAVAWEDVGDGGVRSSYPFVLPSAPSTGRDVTSENELDLRPTVRAMVADFLDGTSVPTISARFHRTLIEATAEMLLAAGGRSSTVVLAGGCFQNRRLEAGVRERLRSLSIAVPRDVPINDGGIALGQAWAAALTLRQGS